MSEKAISPVVKIIPLELEAAQLQRPPIPTLLESKRKSKRISESIIKKKKSKPISESIIKKKKSKHISQTIMKKENQEKAEKSKNVSSDSFILPEICSHCNIDLNSEKDVYLEITGEIADIKVSNPNALVYVYESRGNEKYPLVGQSVFLRNENNPLPMCRQCSSGLTKLYQAFKQFSQLCHLESSISRQLEELQAVQISISNQESLNKRLNDNCTLRIDSCSSVNVKLENADTFTENDGDDFLNTDYLSDIDDTNDTFEKELSLKNNRPKRNARSTRYSDYAVSSIDPEDESSSEFLPDSDDEAFEPKQSVNIKKRKMPGAKIKDKINIKVEESEQVEDYQDLATSQANKRKRRKFKSGESRTCPYCSKKFFDPSTLRRHIRVHTDQDNDKLTCKECSKKFTREDHLARHMLQIHSATSVRRKEVAKKGKEGEAKTKREEFKKGESDTCTYCFKVFLNPGSLRRHIRIHTDQDNDKLTCTVCFKKFTRPYHMNRHMIDVHRTNPPQKPDIQIKQAAQKVRSCPVCFVDFHGKFADFKEHIKSHNVDTPYKCTLCPKSFAVPSRLKQHMGRAHVENSNEEYFCQVCHAKFGYSYLRLCHQRTQHSVPNNISLESLQLLESVGYKDQENNRYKCTLCEKAYSRKDRLSMHMLSHTTDAPFSCEICSRRFLQKRSLIRHKLLHNDQNPHVCKICSRSFSRPDHLKRHLETSHRPQQPKQVTCEVCGKQFQKPYQLKIHNFAHTKEKPWKCKVCGKEFNRASSLAYHQRVHSEVRAYCCCTCGRTFKRAGHLRDHEALHLDLPKPYKCEVENCGKSFSRGTHLRKHMVVHSGVKCFECSECNATFNRADNLRMHHRTVHLRDPTAKRKQRPKKRLPEWSETPEETEYKHFDLIPYYN